MTIYRDIPLNNWTGKTVDIDLQDGGFFSMYDYEWHIEPTYIDDHHDMAAFRLYQEGEAIQFENELGESEFGGWTDTLFCDGTSELAMISRAVAWIGNQV